MRTRILAAAALSLATASHADEGMWLFNKPPVAKVKSAYNFEMTPPWLEHLQKSAVKIGGGASGSFVSANGLVLTNHHVGSGMIEKLSTREKDLYNHGFYAATLEEELRCPDMEMNVLMSIEDVTARVRAAVKPGASAEDGAKARRAVIAEIEKESQDATGFRSDVITLYQGGAYHLYRYDRFTDVRLVFCPDAQAATFGGDPDNFEFPRYCLDLCFFRVYRDGKPAATPNFLKWNAAGAKDGELVFIAGHPGRTNRLNTYAELEAMRDDGLPFRMEQIYRGEAVLEAWAARDRENRRRATGSITGIRNGRKAVGARLEGLLDASFMAHKAQSEKALRESFRAKEEWKDADAAFDRIAAAEKESETLGLRGRMLGEGNAFGTSLFGIARTLVRAADEREKPNRERLKEFQDAGKISLELDLFSDEPIYRDMEAEKLASSLTVLCNKLGADDPLVAKIMAGKPPRERAEELVSKTRLIDVGLRKSLYEGGRTALAACEDPMLDLARLVDPESRELRKKFEAIDETVKQAHEKISAARFAIEGDSNYPDATGSLRLAFGVVKGYREGGSDVPSATTLGGLFARSELQGHVSPFQLPATWSGMDQKIASDTPFNFVCTADITGGNSGSPVVNQKGELVGLVFDGNQDNLKLGFGYHEGNGRCVSVHAAGMLETLDKIYGAKRVTQEITQ
ncbi:S46 family peptidase [Haloferula sp. BvORR071]|uniref:S46 family peptidase n=1 Tax=Haloferula sp. BvORR071 TaxID=1396141 RepID=UPI00054D4418|nr:S46 family peptidase [Haloferula sp. BvORR071]